VPASSVLSLQCRPGIEPCSGVNLPVYLLGTVSPCTRIKQQEREAHHTFPSLPESNNSVIYPTVIHLPSQPVHLTLRCSLFHYGISHVTDYTCSCIRDDKMQPVYTDTSHVPFTLTDVSHLNVEWIFSVNVLSICSKNNTDESHTYRLLDLSKHCAGHHCPSGLGKLQFPAVCHY